VQTRTLIAAPLALLAAGALCAPRAAVNPLQGARLAADARYTIVGEVVERLDAGPYVYLRLQSAAGARHWVAAVASFTPGSRRVEARVIGRAQGFRSARVGRDFPLLLFAVVTQVTETERTNR
jgi:hypothetical protein